MNVLPSAWRKRLLALAATSSLLVMSGHAVFAEPNDAEALAAAKAWMAQIDAGQYIESYNAGCDAFHQKITQDKWVVILKAFRPSFGAVVSRREISHVYKEDGVNGLDGECMVITYDTTFRRLQSGSETVVLKLEDGKWRGAGYVAGPKADSESADNDSGPGVQTDVQTIRTQHPDQ